ncbi:MAG: hypothetical protein PWP16_21 [Eubacteriaceae bacterium]|jgi:MFS family permease|nr:hypothetical protein [Eubacteriaceae bacterium]MDN5306658.1 hypothetical protein [Eubacteriaceae bacterium]
MKNKTFLKIAILSVFFVGMAVGTITPAIASIAAAFPEVPFTTLLLVSTLPTLLSVPATLVSGRIAGIKVKYKTLLLVGMILFLISGMSPYFIDNFTTILLFRAIFGISIGIMAPLGAVLIISFFDGPERASMMGISGVVGNVGGILFQLLGGVFAASNWNYAFLAHGIGIVTLLLVFFIPEPPKVPAPPITDTNAPKMKMPKMVWVFAFMALTLMMLNYPLLVNMSSLIAAYDMGTTADAAMVLTTFTIGGMVAGLLFAKLFGILKKNLATVGLLLMALAMLSIASGTTILFMYIGAALSGMGFSLIFPSLMIDLDSFVPGPLIPTASAMIVSFMNIGGFISAYFYAFVAGILGQTENMKFPFIFATVAFFGATILYAVLKPKAADLPQTETLQ